MVVMLACVYVCACMYVCAWEHMCYIMDIGILMTGFWAPTLRDVCNLRRICFKWYLG